MFVECFIPATTNVRGEIQCNITVSEILQTLRHFILEIIYIKICKILFAELYPRGISVVPDPDNPVT